MRIGRPFFGAALPHSAWKIGWGYPLFLVCFRPKAEHRDLIFDEKSGTETSNEGLSALTLAEHRQHR